jgi:hypothetical protein
LVWRDGENSKASTRGALKSGRRKAWGKTYRKERAMKKKVIAILFIWGLFLICLGCSSKPLPDKGVMILSPKANDVLKAGESCEILWKAEPSEAEFGTMVTVEFSKDVGKSWEKVQENVPNSGNYVWKVPKVDSTQCKIRIFSQYRPIYRGTSEVFSVK